MLFAALAAQLTLGVPDTASPAFAQQQDRRECELSTTAFAALPDAGGLYYRRVGLVPEYAPSPGGPEWRQVGLYGQGRTTRPAGHEQAGLAIAQDLQPIDGKLVMLSIGMSNTFQEFGRFESRADSDPAVHPDLVILNAAQGSRPADHWNEPDDPTWDEVDTRLAQQGLTPSQVQVAWMKHAVRSPMFPPLDFPAHPETLRDILFDVVQSMKQRYPNLKLLYLSSRTRAYMTDQTAQSPEPAAYEGGFAVQWLIEQQLAGDPGLRFDGIDPPAPWLSWGPYLWTDGTGAAEGEPHDPFAARSDGFVWTCADVDRDGVHPSPPTPDVDPPTGEFKVGDELMAFFKTDVTTTPWFLGATGGPAILSLTANGQDLSGGGVLTGDPPFRVDLDASASGAVAEYTWTYDDGTFSYNPAGNSSGMPAFNDSSSATKEFRVTGLYDVRLTVSDTAGRTTRAGFEVIVGGLGPCGGALELALRREPGSDSVELRWCSLAGAESYNLYRGTAPDLGDLTCLESDLSGPSTTDDAPAFGLQVYLLSWVAAGIESDLGQGSNGMPRAAPPSCP
ncbi:hypothetical protein ABI59_15955 [Acidobacteria bacterium Mor1]|nr:hypothetical protein ABI59_15955 [Acidobacteria bacterium Mor1]